MATGDLARTRHDRDNAPMNSPHRARVSFDSAAYARRSRQGRCFVCAIVAGDHAYHHHIVYQDADTIAFLNRYPTLLGYCLVAPRQHVENWAHELTEAQFLELQRVTYRVARAVAAAVPTERMYSLSLGSRQANAHVHWHVAPLPPGIPYDQQEFGALLKENGVLDVTDDAQAELANAIRSHL